jgi:hypothetical protein
MRDRDSVVEVAEAADLVTPPASSDATAHRPLDGFQMILKTWFMLSFLGLPAPRMRKLNTFEFRTKVLKVVRKDLTHLVSNFGLLSPLLCSS